MMAARRDNAFQRWALVFVLSTIVVTVVVPFGMTAWLAFTDFSFNIPGRDGAYIGLANFTDAVKDERFLNSLARTILFTAVAVPVEIGLGLLIALAIPIRRPAGHALLPFIILPLLLSGIAVGLIWRLLLHGDFGVLPYALRAVGLLDTGSLLGSPGGAFLSILVADIWQWTPFCVVVLLAGRASLSEPPYLAARLDGAGTWRVFRDVTLPGLRASLLICLLFRTMDCIREFDKIKVMTNGGPVDHTELIGVYLWNVSFIHGALAYGAALTLLIYLAVLIGSNLLLLVAQPRKV